MKLRLLNDVSVLKSTDNATAIELAVTDNQDEVLDLSQYLSISVAIGYNGTQYSTENPVLSEDKMSFSFTLSNALPATVYNVEVTLVTKGNKNHIAPSEGKFNLTIEKSLNEIGETITVISVQQLLDDMAETKRIATDVASVVDETKQVVSSALIEVTNALNKANEADLKAIEANAKSDNALADVLKANQKADDAISIANQASTKADDSSTIAAVAVEKSEQANTKADNAATVATQSDVKSTNAETVALSVESRFNELTLGNTNDEVIQARGMFTDVKSRLDDSDSKLNKKYEKASTGIPLIDLSEEVKTVIAESGKVKTVNGNLPDQNGNVTVDLSAYEKTVDVTTKLSSKVDKVSGKGLSTNDFTTVEKNKLASLENADLSGYATISSVDTKLVNKVDVVSGKGLSTNDFTTAEKNKLASLSNTDTSTLATKEELTTHKADEAAHGIGNKATLKTTDKTTIVGAVNELFTDVDNGKTQIANAIVGKNGTASSSDTFTQLASAISLLGGGVKSVQRGYLNEQLSSVLSKNITISAVNPDNTIVLIDNYGDTSNAFSRVFKTIELVNDVTIKIESGEYYAALYDNWQVLEFDKLKSKQSGVVQLNQLETSKDISLKKVDLSKIGVFFSWTTNSSRTSTGSNDSIASHMPRLVVANDSTLTISRQKLYTPVGTITLRWQVVEFE